MMDKDTIYYIILIIVALAIFYLGYQIYIGYNVVANTANNLTLRVD